MFIAHLKKSTTHLDLIQEVELQGEMQTLSFGYTRHDYEGGMFFQNNRATVITDDLTKDTLYLSKGEGYKAGISKGMKKGGFGLKIKGDVKINLQNREQTK
jgi:hypothetical protein